MFGVFLAFYDASGERHLKKLDINSFWLPSAAPKKDIKLQVDAQTGVLIEIKHRTETAMLTNFDECTVLGERRSEVELPVSTTSQRFTLLLREGDHILTPAGRWEVLWEDEQGSIHNSMRPPALPGPLLPSDALEPLETENAVAVEPAEATPSQASPTEVSNDKVVKPIETAPSQSSHTTAPNGATVEPVESVPSQASPVAASSDTRASTSSSTATANNEKAVDVTSPLDTTNNDVTVDASSSSTTTDDNGEEEDVTVSTAPSNSASATSIEPEPIQNSPSARKRPADNPSAHSENKRVRFSPSPDEAVDNNDEPAEPEINETIQVIVPTTPSLESARKAKKKSPETSSASPATNTRAQRSMSKDWAPVVYMAGNTTIDSGHKKIMRSFHELGGSITKNIVDADVLCVGKDKPLLRSGSLLLAITSGKIIVTEKWIIDANRNGSFPDATRYMPQDPDREREWGFNLAAAVARGRQGLTHLLAGATVYLTKQLQKSVTATVATELSKLATALGADGVKKSSPSKRFLEECGDPSTIVVLGNESDPELYKLVDLGLSVYSKDLLTMAALRGKVEFKAHTLASAFKEEDE